MGVAASDTSHRGGTLVLIAYGRFRLGRSGILQLRPGRRSSADWPTTRSSRSSTPTAKMDCDSCPISRSRSQPRATAGATYAFRIHPRIRYSDGRHRPGQRFPPCDRAPVPSRFARQQLLRRDHRRRSLRTTAATGAISREGSSPTTQPEPLSFTWPGPIPTSCSSSPSKTSPRRSRPEHPTTNRAAPRPRHRAVQDRPRRPNRGPVRAKPVLPRMVTCGPARRQSRQDRVAIRGIPTRRGDGGRAGTRGLDLRPDPARRNTAGSRLEDPALAAFEPVVRGRIRAPQHPSRPVRRHPRQTGAELRDRPSEGRSAVRRPQLRHAHVPTTRARPARLQPLLPLHAPSPSEWSIHRPNLARAKRLVSPSGTRGERVDLWGCSPTRPTFPAACPCTSPTCSARSATARTSTWCRSRRSRKRCAGAIQLSADGDWMADYPDPSSYIPQFFACGGGNSNGYYCDPQLDRKMREAALLDLHDPAKATASGPRSITTLPTTPPGCRPSTSATSNSSRDASITTSTTPSGASSPTRAGSDSSSANRENDRAARPSAFPFTGHQSPAGHQRGDCVRCGAVTTSRGCLRCDSAAVGRADGA